MKNQENLTSPPQSTSQFQPAQSPLQHWLPTIVGIAIVVFGVGGFFVFQFLTKSPVVQPSITVLSPNGGEELVAGQAYTVTWNVHQVEADKNGIAIFLQDQSSSPWKTFDIAKNIPPASKDFLWTVPSTMSAGSKYKILITGVVAGATQPYQGTIGLSDVSDNYFSIVSATTASWKTYRNEEFGFEIKYPREWIAKEKELFSLPTEGARWIVEFGDPDDPVFITESYQASLVWIWVFENTRGLSALEYAQEFNQRGGNTAQLTVDGEDAWQVVQPRIYSGIATFVVHGDKEYEVVTKAIRLENRDLPVALYDQILSTLKFID